MAFSRQRRWQLRKQLKGLCTRCGKRPLQSTTLCKECLATCAAARRVARAEE